VVTKTEEDRAEPTGVSGAIRSVFTRLQFCLLTTA